jgi:hypothetical protein
MVGELYRQVANALEDKPCRVYVAPFDVRLPKATEEDDLVDTVVQPDVFIVSDLKTGSPKSSHRVPPATTRPSNSPLTSERVLVKFGS